MKEISPVSTMRRKRKDLVSHWLSEKIYYRQEEYFNDILSGIQDSKQSIELETYIFQVDLLGKKVIDFLIFAAARGVRVRVIVDGFGSFFWIPMLTLFFDNTNVLFKVYNSLSLPQATARQGLSRLYAIPEAFAQFNKRLHRKTCIIDGAIMFTGSFNISGAGHRESGVRVTGKQVISALRAFNDIWRGEPTQNSKHQNRKALSVRLNNTETSRSLLNADLMERIRSAVGRVWVTSAYFVPPLFLIRALKSARKNNVDVTLIVPARSSNSFMRLVMETYFSALLQSGVKIFEYKKRFLHAKTLLIDNWTLVGSSNMNHRSFFHDLELEVVLGDAASLTSMEEKFLEDKQNSIELYEEQFSRRPYWGKALGSFIHLFRNWL